MCMVTSRQFSRTIASIATLLSVACGSSQSPTAPSVGTSNTSTQAPNAAPTTGQSSTSSAERSVAAAAAVVTGSNRIDGVAWLSGSRGYERARNARIEVVAMGTTQVVHRGGTNARGEYTAFAGVGRFVVVATMEGLSGRNDQVWFFKNGGQRAKGINILMR